jgi:hypothetical protein
MIEVICDPTMQDPLQLAARLERATSYITNVVSPPFPAPRRLQDILYAQRAAHQKRLEGATPGPARATDVIRSPP